MTPGMSRKLRGSVARRVRALTARKRSTSRSERRDLRRLVGDGRQRHERRPELLRERRLDAGPLAHERVVARRGQRPPLAQAPQHRRVEALGVRRVEQRGVAPPRLVDDHAAVLGQQRAGAVEGGRAGGARSGRRRPRAPRGRRRSAPRRTAPRRRRGRRPGRGGAAPRRRPRRRRPPSAAPRSAASTAMRSATPAASGPMLSSVGASGRSPVRSIRAADGLKPATRQNAAGTRIDPAVSVPIATGTIPAATATAEPDDEPPGTRPGARGLGGVPKCGFVPSPENASSLRFVLPTQTIPAAASRATTGASAAAGGASRRSADAAVVGVPATSSRSFHATGTPSSGPRRVPARWRPALAAASRRARSSVSRVNTAGAARARSSAASHSASASSSPAASRRPSASAVVTRRPPPAGSGGACRTGSCAPPPGARRGARRRRGPRGRA